MSRRNDSALHGSHPPAPEPESAEPDPPRTEAERVACRIDQLRQQGAAAFDSVGFLHVERLAARAQHLGTQLPGAGRRLWMRAEMFLEALETRWKSAQDSARQTAERLQRLGVLGEEQPLPDPARLRQLGRRHPYAHPRLRERLGEQWCASLKTQAVARGLLVPPSGRDAEDGLEPASSQDLALALYRDRTLSIQATVVVTRAVEELPEIAGRYHASSVAARALQTMQDVPPYLKALLERLAALAVIERYCAPLEAAERGRQGRRGARKNRAAGATKRSQAAKPGAKPARPRPRSPKAPSTGGTKKRP